MLYIQHHARRLALGLLLCLALLALLATALWNSRAFASNSPAQTASGALELWRLGVTSEGSADYGMLTGRLAEPMAAFRSNRGTNNIFFVFPATGAQQTIDGARYYLLRRSGNYAGSSQLTLEVRALDGSPIRTVSTAVDLETAELGSWNSFALSTAPGDLLLAPGEILVARFALSEAAGGDFDARVMFEVGLR